jgi:hypothetical protein
MLSAIWVFSDTGTYAFPGQGRNRTQQDVISNAFVTKESRVCFTLNMKFSERCLKMNITSRQVESPAVNPTEMASTLGRDVDGYLGVKGPLFGKEVLTLTPRLELGGCHEEVCGEAAELLRSFNLVQN